MLLFVGLGNPGGSYANNRHNIGFMAADEIVRRHDFSTPRRRFQGQVHEGRLGGKRIALLKPMTFMNDSGRSVGEAARYYKIDPAQVVIFYDELDLAAGKVRVKTGGGAAGHNGLRSITQHIGPDFRRVRIGIGHPGHKSRVQKHVLSDFSKTDRQWVTPLLDAIAEVAPALVEGDNGDFTTKLALILNPPRENKSRDEGDRKKGPN